MIIDEALTARGFQIARFADHNGVPCSLQQSSVADYDSPGTSAIWFGLGAGDRMHLSLEQVKRLLPYLQRWAENGELFEDE